MENIDLTMLARSAYRAILRDMEVKKNEKTQTSPDMAGQPAQPAAGRPDRLTGWSGSLA
ncbi:MAG: hypothetical protein J6M56_14980 [Clostridia bacterium]|nr:hypothetical protein [Clostridia bacterium]